MKTAKEIIETMKQTYTYSMALSCPNCKNTEVLTTNEEICNKCKFEKAHFVMYASFFKVLDIPPDKGLPSAIVSYTNANCFNLERYDENKDKMIADLEELLGVPEHLAPVDKIECKKCGQMISPDGWILEGVHHPFCFPNKKE